MIICFIMKGKVISNVLTGLIILFLLLGSIYFIVSFVNVSNEFSVLTSQAEKEATMKNYLSLFIPFVIVNFILCTLIGAVSCFVYVNSVMSNTVSLNKELIFKFVMTFIPMLLLIIYCVILFTLK